MLYRNSCAVMRLCMGLVTAMGILHALVAPANAVSFVGSRKNYQINLVPGGSQVIGHGVSVFVPFGEVMAFDDMEKTSKDTDSIVHNITSHAEAYMGWDVSADLPAEFLRSACNNGIQGVQPVFPDRAEKVTVAYVNACEFSAVGGWDPSFDPSWDLDHDYRIDPGVTNLPDYVDLRVYNAEWKNYVAVYWTQAWRDQLAFKINLAVAQGFDGIMLDVMTGYWTWNAVPSNTHSLAWLRERMAGLFRWVSNYAESRYGDSFIISANLDRDAYQWFPDMGSHIDAGYYQNAFWDWNGSGALIDYGAGNTPAALQFVKAQGLQLLNMDHLGTGSNGDVDWFTNNDRNITRGKLVEMLRLSAKKGTLPFVAPLLFGVPYELVPARFAKVGSTHVLTGTAYPDWVIGSAAADQISGGDGDDVFLGGAGNDKLDGGAGSDTAAYVTAAMGVTVTLATPAAQDTKGAGKDTLVSIEQVIGSAYADRLTGSAGNETLEGAGGNDFLNGRGGFDFASYATAKSKVKVSLAITAAQRTGGAGVDTLRGFEGLIGSGFADALTGNAAANTLIGGNGNDSLNGRGGDDRLEGGFGTDILAGGAGADSFVFAALETEQDLITDLEDIDTIDLSGIDADLNAPGDQAFTLVGAFSGAAGQAVLTYDPVKQVTLLQLDVDGRGSADMTIAMKGNHASFTRFVF